MTTAFSVHISSMMNPETGFSMVRIPLSSGLLTSITVLADFDDDYHLEDICNIAFKTAQVCILARWEGYAPVMLFPNGKYEEIPSIPALRYEHKAEAYLDWPMPAIVHAELVAGERTPEKAALDVLNWFLTRGQEMGFRGGRVRFYHPKSQRLISIEKQRKIENRYEKKAG